MDPVITGATTASRPLVTVSRGEVDDMECCECSISSELVLPNTRPECAPDPRFRQRSGRPNPPPLRVSNAVGVPETLWARPG